MTGLPDRAAETVRRSGSSDLLYVSNSDKVAVFSYPAGKKHQILTGLVTPSGLCSDAAGDVFITDFGGQSIVEYAHGGAAPVATLNDRYEEPNDCAIDPVTGNLAVANIDGSVSIYKQAKGKPEKHVARKLPYMLYLTYDDRGDLFVDGEDAEFENFVLVELPAGSKNFKTIALDRTPAFPGGIQWDGQYLAVADQDYPHIFRFAISGDYGTTQSVVTLNGAADIGEFWDLGSSIVVADMVNRDVSVWNYPGGGDATMIIAGFREPLGVTLSNTRR